MNLIDLDEATKNGTVKNLSGKQRGEDARVAFKLDTLDLDPEPVIVKVPEYLYAISSSYFLGLFSQSVTRSGSAEKFLAHYQFQAGDAIMRQVMHGISRCLMPRAAPPTFAK